MYLKMLFVENEQLFQRSGGEGHLKKIRPYFFKIWSYQF